MKVYAFTLAHCIMVDTSTGIYWMSPYVILGVSGYLVSFISSPEPMAQGGLLPPTVVRRQQFALNNIFHETTKPRALIFDTKYCLVDLNQVCSNGGPGSSMALRREVLCLKIKYT